MNQKTLSADMFKLHDKICNQILSVSLALADVTVGGIVMPFSIRYELNNQVWYYGIALCDLWHSFDALGSTASILNLCIISLDRYWAITDQIAYPNRMTSCRVSILITFVWLCPAGISFPAIAWWKAVAIVRLEIKEKWDQGVDIKPVIWYQRCDDITNTTRRSPAKSHETTSFRKQSESEEEDTSLASNAQTPVHSASHSITNHSDHNELHHHHHNHNQDEHSHNQRPMKFITKRLRQLALSKKLSKLANGQKAAKTLGIVVGVFIICWMPFFVVNVLLGICGASCVSKLDITMPVFTWFGYLNSGVNPIIYALSMRDFRRAFGRIIFVVAQSIDSRTDVEERRVETQTPRALW
ncbi:5HT1B-like protein, partial [Mya arenaria]